MFRVILSVFFFALAAIGLLKAQPVAHAASVRPNSHGHAVEPNVPLNHLVKVTKTTTSNAGSSVTCPAGYLILSGGFSGNKDLNVYMNTKAGNGWKVKAKAFNGGNNTRTVHALCISNDFEVAYSSGSTTVDENTLAGTFAYCPEDYEIVAGGWSFASKSMSSYDSGRVAASYANNSFPSEWLVFLQNGSNIARNLKVTAICILTLEINPQYNDKYVSVDAHKSKNATLKCTMPDFFEMIGGGFNTFSHRIVASYPMDAATKWRNTFYNPLNTASNAFSRTTCAELAAL